MKRGLFNVCAAISLLLFLATGVLWAHSYFADDSLSFGRASASRATNPDGTSRWNCANWVVSSEANCGRLLVSYDAMVDSLNTDELHIEHGFRIDARSDRHHANELRFLPWFGWSNTFDGSEVGGEAALQFPLVLLFVFSGLLPFLALRRIARERGRPESICPLCGYDRRATPGRCPECGAGFAVRGAAN